MIRLQPNRPQPNQKLFALMQRIASVAKVFGGYPVSRIDFHLDGLHISPAKLKAVGDAIVDLKITVDVGNTSSMGAVYEPHKKRILLSDWRMMDTPVGRAGILHEGVHALVDLFSCNHLTVFADEAAAYLAEALYLSNLGIRAIAHKRYNQAIFDAARGLVETHQLRYKMGVRLTKQDYAPLHKALQNHPGYGKTDPKQMAGCGGHSKHP